jgi:hypothetical protein
MGRIEKSVFISYRRTAVAWALSMFKDLTSHGFDTFFDYHGLASGSFENVIFENIRARAHLNRAPYSILFGPLFRSPRSIPARD